MKKRPERDLIVFAKYTMIIKEMGDLARSVKKKTLYEKTAEYFYLEPETIQRIVLTTLMDLKRNRNSNLFSKDELNDMLITVQAIHDTKDEYSRNYSREQSQVQ